MKIENNTVVTIDYKLTNDQAEELDTSDNGEPIVYLHGGDELIDGLERALNNRSAGDQFSVTLTPDEAYGDEDTNLIQIFPIDEFNGVEIAAGMELQGEDPDGNYRILRVTAVDGDDVHVNMNHPLAGMTLTFDLHVKDVRVATEEELDHGHAHG